MHSLKLRLCPVQRTSYRGAQHAQRVVVKRNSCTEDTCNNTQRVVTSNQWPVQTCTTAAVNKWNRMYLHVTMFVRCVYHHCQTGLLYATYMYNYLHQLYVQVYCVLEFAITMMYRSMCATMQACATSVSQHERMHVRALCVSIELLSLVCRPKIIASG